MGIKTAATEAFVVLRHVYAHCRTLWGAACQVSGQFDSGANSSSSPAPLGLRRIHKDWERRSSFLSRSQPDTGRLRKMMICAGRISQADKWLIGVTRTNGRKRLLRRVSNALDSISPVKWWRTLRSACAEWKIIGWLAFKGFFVSLLSGFFRRMFRILTRNLSNGNRRHWPVALLLKNRSTLRVNAES
jgi:hypothetical protein